MENKENKKGKKVAFVTLGCKVNQYESNAMAGKFKKDGYNICNINDNPNIIIVNTCTVTNVADRKSRQTLRKVKDENPKAIVVAVGCYVQVAKDKISKIDEVDLCLGNVEKKDIVNIVENYIEKNETDKFNQKILDVNKQKDFSEFGSTTFTEKTRATIKIQDGCNNFCTYCLIPYARGRVRSRNKDKIIEEVTKNAECGIKEIVITGIHISSYGIDFENNYKLIDLLEDLNKVNGIERIRLGSLEPSLVTLNFVKRLSRLDKICNHFHLSLQSGSDETLKRMNRKYSTDEFREVVRNLRTYFKDVNLTTDVIVGFPRETDEEFNTTYKFLKEINFYKMHIFKYSAREGTIAASMEGQIDGNVKEERSNKLINLSNENELKINKKLIGNVIEVLFEEKQNNYWTGHTTSYVVVKVNSKENLENKIVKVKIISANEEEVFGELI